MQLEYIYLYILLLYNIYCITTLLDRLTIILHLLHSSICDLSHITDLYGSLVILSARS